MSTAKISATLYEWYENSSIYVKWNNVFSDMVNLYHGVRQGGILSPILFALYVDKMLCELNSSELGCNFQDFPITA